MNQVEKASCFDLEVLRNEYDAIGIEELEIALRERMRQDRLKKISLRTIEANIKRSGGKVSKSYMANFANGQDVCIKTMNTLANYYGIKYLVTNF